MDATNIVLKKRDEAARLRDYWAARHEALSDLIATIEAAAAEEEAHANAPPPDHALRLGDAGNAPG